MVSLKHTQSSTLIAPQKSPEVPGFLFFDAICINFRRNSGQRLKFNPKFEGFGPFFRRTFRHRLKFSLKL